MNHIPYNGHYNYETWAYALWMDNSEASYHMVKRLAQQVAKDELSMREAEEVLSSDLMDMAHDLLDKQGYASVLNDLLISSCQEINFYEYLKGYVDEEIKDIRDRHECPECGGSLDKQGCCAACSQGYKDDDWSAELRELKG
jgi:hypothetical protein